MCPTTDRMASPRRSRAPANVRRFVPVAVIIAATAAGCNEQDMVVQPIVKPYQVSPFFVDGQSARPVVAGTVARGQLRVEPAYDMGKVGDLLVDKFPAKVKVDKAVLTRGRERYNIYCSPCHSRSGDGKGMFVQRGFPPPPSFHTERLIDAPVGHYFNVITNGYGAMYSYASRIPTDDRWAIVAYIRALQLSQHAAIDDVPETERPRLEVEEAEKGDARR
jgi:mono/diheme cytochrome c family protein